MPRAFSGAVSACRFEQGDVLYGRKSGYATWTSRSAQPDPILQVLEPLRSARALSGDAGGNRFSVSWDSAVTLDLFRVGAAARSERHTTTQGRLFSCLWQGSLAPLDEATPALAPPRGLRELHRQIADSVPAFVKYFRRPARAGGHSLFVFATDDASDTARVKARAILSVLADAFEIESHELTPGAAGVAGAEDLHPALLLYGVAIASDDREAIERRLRDLLYSGGEGDTGRFSLSRHGHWVSWADAPGGDLLSP